jgi:hypothetical protein
MKSPSQVKVTKSNQLQPIDEDDWIDGKMEEIFAKKKKGGPSTAAPPTVDSSDEEADLLFSSKPTGKRVSQVAKATPTPNQKSAGKDSSSKRSIGNESTTRLEKCESVGVSSSSGKKSRSPALARASTNVDSAPNNPDVDSRKLLSLRAGDWIKFQHKVSRPCVFKLT